MTVADLPVVESEHRMLDEHVPARLAATSRPGAWRDGRQQRDIAALLTLVADRMPIRRRMMHADDTVYGAGEQFACLYVVNSGFFKTVDASADGRDHVVGLHFRGDWLGFDGIAIGHHGCDAVALDTGEVWALNYDALLRAGIAHPPLLVALHMEMSRAMRRDRESMLSLCTLPVAARVADFLRCLAEALAGQGQCSDRIRLPISRADIANYLGTTLESVSRGFSALTRSDVIRFAPNSRREIIIPDLRALAEFAQGQRVSQGATLPQPGGSSQPPGLDRIAARGAALRREPSCRSMPAEAAIRSR